MHQLADSLNMMTNLTSLFALPLLLLNMTNETSGFKHVVLMDFAHGCPETFTRLDDYEEVEIRTDRSPDIPVTINPQVTNPDMVLKAGKTCSAHFQTGRKDHGVCFRADNMFFRGKGVEISLWTTLDGPDKVFHRENYKNFTSWCTTSSQVTLKVNVRKDVTDQNSEFRFSFIVENVTKNDMSKIYSMDSFKECDLHHQIHSGEIMTIQDQRYSSAEKMPLECQMTVSTTSNEEYEQLCVTMTVTYSQGHDCQSQLEVSGLHDSWWTPVKTFGCTTDIIPTGEVHLGEMCSKDKSLTFKLTRNSTDSTGMTFQASIKSKWHPFWEAVSQEKTEQRGLDFVKGFTYFIAAIDSLAGILAAVLATMIRHPRGFWKDWADSKSRGTPSPDALTYEVNYPVVSQLEEASSSEAAAY